MILTWIPGVSLRYVNFYSAFDFAWGVPGKAPINIFSRRGLDKGFAKKHTEQRIPLKETEFEVKFSF